ncbi:MAG: GNAT family N-acetyltransferase, partial [Frankia sp.]|nr:GNAT family N-acetyltransferase [Frankia sp.]
MYEGKLVRLRAQEPADIPLLFQWFNDPEVTSYLALRYPLSMRDEQDFVESVKSVGYQHAHFAIEAKDTGDLIGGVDLREVSAENRHADLGIALGNKAYWDRGYGTDAMRTICRFGFEEMNLHRIQLWVHGTNPRAQRVYEKIGFVVEGRA